MTNHSNKSRRNFLKSAALAAPIMLGELTAESQTKPAAHSTDSASSGRASSRNYLGKDTRLSISMWDFSWLMAHYPGGAYEDLEHRVAEAAERGYNTLRVDCFPSRILEGESIFPKRDWTPGVNLPQWGEYAIDHKCNVRKEIANLAGTVKENAFDGRQTPFLKAHSTEVGGLHDNPHGDDRFYNNVFVQLADLSVYDAAQLPMWMDGNVYLDGARPSKFDLHAVVAPDFDPRLQLVSKPGNHYLDMRFDKKWTDQQARKLVTTALLGKAQIPDLPFEQPDGAPIRIDTDYFGKKRNPSNPMPGPFERPRQGDLTLKVW